MKKQKNIELKALLGAFSPIFFFSYLLLFSNINGKMGFYYLVTFIQREYMANPIGRPKKENTKTNAERQAEYRAKHRYSSEKAVLHTYLNIQESVMLDLIVFHYGVTKKKMLEMLIENEYQELGKRVDLTELNEKHHQYKKEKI